jgi:hypothetical protein
VSYRNRIVGEQGAVLLGDVSRWRWKVAECGRAAEAGDLAEVRKHPCAYRRQVVAVGRREALGDELRLAAVAARRGHQCPRPVVGDGGAAAQSA